MLTTPSPYKAHYFKITGNASMTAGGENLITITAYTLYGNIATTYIGDKFLTFEGAGSPLDSTILPTCSNKNNTQINFGSDTLITFRNGVGTSTMKLYKEETAHIRVSTLWDSMDTVNGFEVEIMAGTIRFPEIPGVTVPTSGATPVTTITETSQYTGIVTWNPADNPFLGKKIYTATITLTAKNGFAFEGVTENFFAVVGVETLTHTADSGIVTAIFPETALGIGDAYSGGMVAYFFVAGDPGYIAGEQHGLIAAIKDQAQITEYNGVKAL